ncbi:MAG: hypothetical protein ACJA08_002698 [Cyclobacteriaceae bacterium]|jgi:hypothetical protein
MINHFRLLIIFLLTSGFLFDQKSDREPWYFLMNEEWKEVVFDESVFSFSGLDSLEDHIIRLLSNQNKEPLLFYCDLETAVCADGQCRLARVKVYWNLLGNYVGYGIHPDDPLTKYDHVPFEHVDYEKLHKLLQDKNSLLSMKTMYDLVHQVTENRSASDENLTVDGISSATKKEISRDVVKGGLYSCYTLWHLVNGNVTTQMKSYLDSIQSEALITYFLHSHYLDYQMYAVKQLSADELKLHINQILNIFSKAQPVTQIFILKKMTAEMLAEKAVSESLFSQLEDISVSVRTELIGKINYAHQTGAEIVSYHLGTLTKSQLKSYINFLTEHPEKLSGTIEANLNQSVQSKKLTYGYLIEQFLVSRN